MQIRLHEGHISKFQARGASTLNFGRHLPIALTVCQLLPLWMKKYFVAMVA